MSIQAYLEQLRSNPEQLKFADLMTVIAQHYQYQATRFVNGIGADRVINEAGKNEGSCKLFAFAKSQQLSEQETLNCFAEIYRDDVIAQPDADNHHNIRRFMRDGWAGVTFDGEPLKLND